MTDDDEYIQRALPSDDIQFENIAIENVRNGYTQSVRFNSVSWFSGLETTQHAEPDEDISNKFGNVQPSAANARMQSDNLLTKVNIPWRGYFGSVDSVKITGHSDIRMAVKRISRSTKEERVSARHTELKMMQEFGSGICPYIIDYYGAMIDTEYSELCICMELMDTTIKKFYENMHQMRDIVANDIERFLCRVIHNISSALEFLALQNYVHRDIKPENMLVDKHAVVKLSDFGTCCKINETNSVQSSAMGTVAYFAPELVQTSTSTKLNTIQRDMWALGISLVEIVIGKHPCLASEDTDQSLEIIAWNPEIPATIISMHMQEFILNL
ncbi:unnamed protein product [Rotaria sp. Silwood1]|nr:unnamed protein product [Rotaria sp. Silwood1]